MAGLYSNCSANTYPTLKVGDGSSNGFDLQKQIVDSQRVVEKSLDPGFFKAYELDGQFPMDWRLELGILEKRMFFDSLVGRAVVDLEDRFYGDPTNKQRLAYELHAEHNESELKKFMASGGMAKNETAINNCRQIKNEIVNEVEKLDTTIQSYVEYLSLLLPGKNISQGSVEVAIEVLPAEVGI